MSKIQQIIDVVTGKEHPDFTNPKARMEYFRSMPLNAQVAMAYRCAQSAANSVIWYTQQIEQAEQSERPNRDLIASNNRERIISTNTLHSILCFIAHAANYTEADGQTILFDQANFNSEIGMMDTDEVTAEENTAVKRAPHAWARDQLIDQGIWPEEFEVTDQELVLFNMDRVADRIASQYVCRVIISLYEDGVYIPQPTDARDIILLGLSPTVSDLNKCKTKKALSQAILQLACKNPPYINDKPYTRETIANYFNGLIEADEEAAEKSNLKNEIKDINATVKEAIRTHALMGAMVSGASEMKKAGMSDDLIKAITGQMAAKISPQ
jgi:hypothetical protein